MLIRRIVPLMLAASLAVVLAVLLEAGLSLGGPVGAMPAGAATAGDAQSRACARLQARVAKVPAWQDRISAQIARLEEQLDRLRSRRGQAATARVGQVAARIEPLRRLAAQLDAQVAEVERRCG